MLAHSIDTLTDNRGLATIVDWLRWTYSRFNEHDLYYGHGSDNSWDEANHLILQALSLPWDVSPALYGSKITETEAKHLAHLVRRRIQERIPVAYLLKSAWFAGMPFYVDERVLIPRSPVAELLLEGLSDWLDGVEITDILDLCTGSGCIGIACAMAFPETRVDLLDVCPDALQVAQINIDKHELWERVSTIESDLFAGLSPACKGRYQLIISNPPYVDDEDLAFMPQEYHHEPKLGLVAGEDGLDLVRVILAKAADYLACDGLLVLEVGNSRDALERTFTDLPFVWPEFAHGGHGVCLLRAADLKQAHQPESAVSV